MKIKLLIIIIILLISFSLIGCNHHSGPTIPPNDLGQDTTDEITDLGDDDKTFGNPIEDSGALDGVLTEEVKEFSIQCISGTENCFDVEDNTIIFSNITSDTVYSISGKLTGNIIINVSEEYKFDLELHGFTLQSANINPITILNGNEVAIKAKKDYINYIYDIREQVDENNETLYSGAIHSLVDLEISGKGKLNIVSKNNNGIHSKDDLQVKNLDLFILCMDNALKGNDSVEVEEATINLISTKGDGIKTTNSDISTKGNQRGTVSILNSKIDIYAACDGIDAAYNVIIDGDNTSINIYTDKYSNYSEEVTVNSHDICYIRHSNNSYKYSIKYYNSVDDYEWVDATYHSSKIGGKSTYYYYSFLKKSNYNKIQVFMYDNSQESSQDEVYIFKTELLTPNTSYDTLAFSNRGNSMTVSWTNYDVTSHKEPGGFGGGMNEGNNDKSDFSTKGIKSFNEIIINNGIINIKSYDDAIHVNNDQMLENNQTPSGNITINNGIITLYTNDDAIHADGMLAINNGTVTITNSYEGLEGNKVEINSGQVSIISKDDGINATTMNGIGIQINGGTNYIYCTGDGLDSNSKELYQGIVFKGGKTVVISNSNGNSAIDSEKGYSYQGGYVVAIMPGGGGGFGGMRGMTSETLNCQNFSSVGTKTTISLKSNIYIIITVDEKQIVTIKSSINTSSMIVFLGSNNANITTLSQTDNKLDINNVYWIND